MSERRAEGLTGRPADRLTGVLTGGLMVCGTTSDAGKTTVVAGLCRLLARQGVSVAPFKAQNMALNSAVTDSGHEIGRAQYLQAQAAGVPAEVAMNPILLKPATDRASQVIVRGRPVGTMSAVEYHEAKPELLGLVLDALADLRARFDVVLVEGAGSPAEINLLDRDLVNLSLARAAGLPSIIVGDIDPGGVFASLYGTVAILPDELRATVAGFVINKFRGDPALLGDGTDRLEALTGLPTFGVVPMVPDLHLDAEDSMALAGPPEPAPNASLDVAVLRFPHIANFTDIDPLHLEPDVAVRYVRAARELGRPDLVVLPGSKATVADLAWLRGRGLDRALAELVERGVTTVIGICAGYQMLGRVIDDPDGVEAVSSWDGTKAGVGAGVGAAGGSTDGLGLLPVTTTFDRDKTLTRVRGRALDHDVDGYQIHHGRVRPDPDADVWLVLGRDGDQPDGVRSGPVLGTTVHGLFDDDGLRRRLLSDAAARAGASYRPGGPSPAEHRRAELDRLADQLEASLDLDRIRSLIASADDPSP